jgi:magnesium transporter
VVKPETFVWVALRDAEPAELTQMQEEFGLHELAVEDASRGHQRPKIEEYGDSLFVVVKTIECRGGEVAVGEVDIFVGQDYVLSSRTARRSRASWVCARREGAAHAAPGPAFVLYALMDAVVDRYFPVLDMLETELEIEELIFTQGQQRDNIQRLYELKGKVTAVRHVVAPLMEAVGGCTAAACRRCARRRRNTSAMCTTICTASAPRWTASATPSRRRSRSTCRWWRSRKAK